MARSGRSTHVARLTRRSARGLAGCAVAAWFPHDWSPIVLSFNPTAISRGAAPVSHARGTRRVIPLFQNDHAALCAQAGPAAHSFGLFLVAFLGTEHPQPVERAQRAQHAHRLGRHAAGQAGVIQRWRHTCVPCKWQGTVRLCACMSVRLCQCVCKCACAAAAQMIRQRPSVA